jgi:tRNA-(ms[2]io[6]A)-hydroxylase
MTAAVPREIVDFLGRPTPAAWVEAARGALPLLAVDHANCEKKAAATAMSLMNRYPARDSLVQRMSRLAREELRHFEQVTRLMRRTGISWRSVTASRYASGLRTLVTRDEPGRLVDMLVVGAFIEARSCERFALLAPWVDEPFASFYRGLLASESRHFTDYLRLAREYADRRVGDVEARIEQFRKLENRLVSEPDGEIRFHSGPPASV